jgi:hypothetical protein
MSWGCPRVPTGGCQARRQHPWTPGTARLDRLLKPTSQARRRGAQTSMTRHSARRRPWTSGRSPGRACPLPPCHAALCDSGFAGEFPRDDLRCSRGDCTDAGTDSARRAVPCFSAPRGRRSFSRVGVAVFGCQSPRGAGQTLARARGRSSTGSASACGAYCCASLASGSGTA